MTRALRAGPAALPCAAVVALVLVWLAGGGGFAITTWAPGGLLFLVLLGITVAVVPNRWQTLPAPVTIATALLFAYAAWSFVSITWAEDPGPAYVGATRTLMCAVVFALFALWPQDGRIAQGLLGLLVVGLGVIAGVLLIRLALVDDPRRFFGDGRLLHPTGYPNAAAVVFSMAALPGIVLAAGRGVPPWLRAASAASAVVLLVTGLLALSRGMFLAVPIACVVLVALVPGRVRSIAALAVIAVTTAPALPKLLDVGDAIKGTGGDPSSILGSMALWTLLGALVAGAIAAAAGVVEGRELIGAERAERLNRTLGAVIAAVVALAVVAGLAFGHPFAHLRNGWDSFKGGYGNTTSNQVRLVSGLGSNRYDFYRVGLDVFRAHPVIGIGADNFQGEYLRRGKSNETPQYPHSIELRALLQTGVVGFILLFGAFAAATVGALRAMRQAPWPGGAVAGAGFIGFAVWLIHGSADWFLEFGGISAGAFAMLGLACGLQPRVAARRTAATSRFERVGVAALIVVLALPMLSLWASQHEMGEAAASYQSNPKGALQRLDRASDINPFSDDAEQLKGSIALRFGALDVADEAFARALARAPQNQYATLERGAIASASGDRAQAETWLARAVSLSPRDQLSRDALTEVRRGRVIDVAALNDRIRSAALEIAK